MQPQTSPRNDNKGAWKVILKDHNEQLLKEGIIAEQNADKNCAFIHACDFETIPSIAERFYKGQEIIVLRIDLEQAAREGFTIKYEVNKNGETKYWHFYRPEEEPQKLLTAKCAK